MRYWILFTIACALSAEERTVEPTYLRRQIDAVRPVEWGACQYRPLFGESDPEKRVTRGVTRYGVLDARPGVDCGAVTRSGEESVYVVLRGEGSLAGLAFTSDSFTYVPPGMEHSLVCKSASGCRVVVMGFYTKETGGEVRTATLGEIEKQTVGGHPPSVLYQLMLGDVASKRDRIAAGRTVVSLYVMSFQPGGTNFPHHHDREEEIYLVLDGEGQMVAGSGADGIENRIPAKAGDAFFFRLNCTVGFYATQAPGVKSRILAVRSTYPFGR
jgi:mannose-6-phosphate isomerase-like protein (cupin superfamily)